MLLGREAELERLDRLLEGARAGRGAALTVRGEPGIGKTALLTVARERAEDMQVTQTAGVESEASLPYAALGEIAEPLLGGLAELPEPQAGALAAALALAPAPAVRGDRLAVFAGFLGLARFAARHRPLLIIVDDAQWLDSASAECLGYASRRVEASAIAFLAAARAGEPHALSGREVEQLPLTGLDPVVARAMLDQLDPKLPATVAESLVEAAAGNPLALIELPSLLTPEQREGTAMLEHPLPAGISLQRAFEKRIALLPGDVRQACLVAATSLTPSLGPIQASCEAIGLDPDGLEVAEAEGIVGLSPERVDFCHPLLRGAVYQGAPAAERRRAHRALAEHTDDQDARAWHLATAAVGPDAAVAEALEAAGDRATARGAHRAAADALERAAGLTEDRAARAGRLLAAGLAAAIGGAYERGETLIELADELDDPAMRASVRHSLALVTLNAGVRTAHDTQLMLAEEAERIAAVDPGEAAAIHADAGVAAAAAGNCTLTLASAERAAALLPDGASVTTRCRVLSILGMGLALCGRTAEGRDALDEAGRLLKAIDPRTPAAQSIAFALGARRCTGQERVLRAEATWMESAAREAGAVGLFPYFQVLVADCGYRTGDWEAAQREIAEAIEGAEESGQLASLAIALAIAARTHAARGDERAARSAVERALEIAGPPGYGSALGWGKAALGFLELSLDRIAEAIAELEPLERLFELGGLEDPLIIPWTPDLVEAYSRAGRLEDAGRLVAILAAQVDGNDTPLAGALAARCQGLVAEHSFERAFEHAIELHDRADSPFEHARTLLSYGARLHRARRRIDARERLREALAIFDQLGARPWSERARDELRAAGAVERRRFIDPDELTAQEIRVAQAVARGLTNREVAAELFLSPKTIDFHLGKVYRKLGIHSRTELATLVAAGALDERRQPR